MRPTRRALLFAMAAGAAGPLLARQSATQAPLPPPDPALWAPPVGVPVEDGFAPGPNGNVWFRRFGGGDALPLIVLHGGPAAAHGYMMPYAHVGRDRPTILYDQSGCGRSAAPSDMSRYTVDRYVEELEALRAHLDLPLVALAGHSWGGMLAPAYAARYPQHVGALILAGTAPRVQDFTEAAGRWLAELGPGAAATVRTAEASGNTSSPAYQALTEHYYQLHLCRLAEWPPILTEAGEALARNPVYAYLNGPSEFQFSGALGRYDGRPAARAVRAPTLITCGEFDEAPPLVGRRLQGLIRGSRLQPFAGLSHMSHIEDPARVVGAARDFLGSLRWQVGRIRPG